MHAATVDHLNVKFFVGLVIGGRASATMGCKEGGGWGESGVRMALATHSHGEDQLRILNHDEFLGFA